MKTPENSPAGKLVHAQHPSSFSPFGAQTSWVNVLALALLAVGTLTAGMYVGSAQEKARLEKSCTERFAVDFTGAHRVQPGSSAEGRTRAQQGSGGDESLLSAGGEGGSPAAPVVLTMPATPIKPIPRPKCTDENLAFELHDGTQLPMRQIWSTVKKLPNGGVVQVTALGQCGGFSKPATQLMLRTGESSDVHVMSQIFLQDEFAWLDQVYPDRSQVRRVMDFGSNCGMTLTMFSSMYPNAHIIGVEPEIHNFGMLTLNLGHNPNVYLQRGAAGARIRFDKLQAVAPGSWGFGVKPADGNFKETTVFPTYTVPFLMDKYGWPDLDMLKVDIEGSELELCEDVLAGARWLERVRCISFEMHDRLFDLKPWDRISRTCEKAMDKAGMYHVGRFGELRCWCRVGPELKEQLERKKAQAKARADAQKAKEQQQKELQSQGDSRA